jgi:hypothetical protein
MKKILLVSAWSGNEAEYLRMKEYPACIVNDHRSDTEFATYLSKSFNGSFVWTTTQNKKYYSAKFWSTFCASINIVARRLNGRHNSATNAYFQVTHKSQFQLVTASGLKHVLTLMDYFVPFEKCVWITFILVLVFITLILDRVFLVIESRDAPRFIQHIPTNNTPANL